MPLNVKCTKTACWMLEQHLKPPHSQLYNMDKQGFFSFFKHFSHFLCVQMSTTLEFLGEAAWKYPPLSSHSNYYRVTPQCDDRLFTVPSSVALCNSYKQFCPLKWSDNTEYVFWSAAGLQSLRLGLAWQFAASCAACGDWMSDFEEALKSNFLRWFSSKTWLMDCWRDSSSEHQEYL